MASAPRWTSVPVDPEDLALAGNDERRAAIAALSTVGATTVPGLATTVAARLYDVEPSTVTDEERNECRLALEHVHIPRLDERGVVSYDPERSTVEPRSSPLFEEPLVSLVEGDVPTVAIEALGDERRLRLLKIAHEVRTELPLCDLALYLVAGRRDCPLADVTEAERERCRIELHHNHVPKLVEAGLLERTDDNGVSPVATIHEPIRRVLDLGDTFVRSAAPA